MVMVYADACVHIWFIHACTQQLRVYAIQIIIYKLAYNMHVHTLQCTLVPSMQEIHVGLTVKSTYDPIIYDDL